MIGIHARSGVPRDVGDQGVAGMNYVCAFVIADEDLGQPHGVLVREVSRGRAQGSAGLCGRRDQLVAEGLVDLVEVEVVQISERLAGLAGPVFLGEDLGAHTADARLPE